MPVDPETVDPALAAIAPPAILPAYGSDPVRRRLRITPPLLGEGGAHQIAPVLSYFLLSFNVRTAGDTAAARNWLLTGPSELIKDPIFHYNIACYHCVLGECGPARSHLKRAFDMNGKLRQLAARDKDLANLGDLP